MDDIADAVFTKTQDIIVSDGKVDTANLLQTANINREYLSKSIVYPASYADVVNYGRSANSTPPPLEPLIAWVRRNLSVRDEAEARGIAFAIRQSIAQRGIEGIFFVERAVDDVVRSYAASV